MVCSSLTRASFKLDIETARMLRTDMAVAGIDYKDEAGRTVAFHALRHTFLTLLANRGVHPKSSPRSGRP